MLTKASILLPLNLTANFSFFSLQNNAGDEGLGVLSFVVKEKKRTGQTVPKVVSHL